MDDDYGSFDFTPTFTGEYKITHKIGKEKETKILSTQDKSSKAHESTTFCKEEGNTNYTFTYDECDHEKPPNPKEMEKIYGRGYELLKKLGYNGKWCCIK